MKVLVDTSIWIEFFRPVPRLSLSDMDKLQQLIRDGEVSCMEAIRAELLSGDIISSKRQDVIRGLDALVYRTVDWNDRKEWDGLVELASAIRVKKFRQIGLVDRMIVHSAIQYGDCLWTADKGLKSVAGLLGLALF